jgi:hypothetical protein
MLNEHIAATAIYYYDVENTTPSRIRFRTEAELDNMLFEYEQHHEPLAETFGVDSLRDELAVQELGSISTPQGRLLVFPNTLQHCVEPFRLKDTTKNGHRRFLVLWLVDPHYRVVSTRNVPPQRKDWWTPEACAEMAEKGVTDCPMDLGEARELRLQLMDERSKMATVIEGQFEVYNFCEH